MAADSAADEAVLEALADAEPSDEDAAGADAEIAGNDTKALANAVTWDIDVETYNSHQPGAASTSTSSSGPGRSRMGIWLNRHAALRADDPRAAGAGGDAGRPGVSRADRERVLQHRHQPGQGGRHVAVHEGDRQVLRAAGGFLGGRAPRSLPGHRRRRAPPARPEHALRLALPRGRGLQRRAPAASRAGCAGSATTRIRSLPTPTVLPALRHPPAPPGDQGLRPEADRRGAHREGAGALRLRRHARASRWSTTRSSCRP